MVSCRQRWCLSALPSLAWSFYSHICLIVSSWLQVGCLSSSLRFTFQARRRVQQRGTGASIRKPVLSRTTSADFYLCCASSELATPHTRKTGKCTFIAYYTASLNSYWFPNLASTDSQISSHNFPWLLFFNLIDYNRQCYHSTSTKSPSDSTVCVAPSCDLLLLPTPSTLGSFGWWGRLYVAESRLPI